jgi:hypothetical protein
MISKLRAHANVTNQRKGRWRKPFSSDEYDIRRNRFSCGCSDSKNDRWLETVYRWQVDVCNDSSVGNNGVLTNKWSLFIVGEKNIFKKEYRKKDKKRKQQ